MIESTYGTMYYVDNMLKSVAFYKGSLGLQPTYESPGWTEFNIGGHRLCLHTKHEGDTYTPGQGVLIINQNGLKALNEKMKGDGITVSTPHEVHPGSWVFHMTEPGGNEVSFFGAP